MCSSYRARRAARVAAVTSERSAELIQGVQAGQLVAEIWVVEDVEKLAAELKVDAIGQGETGDEARSLVAMRQSRANTFRPREPCTCLGLPFASLGTIGDCLRLESRR
jgi:hypothetical protein